MLFPFAFEHSNDAAENGIVAMLKDRIMNFTWEIYAPPLLLPPLFFKNKAENVDETYSIGHVIESCRSPPLMDFSSSMKVVRFLFTADFLSQILLSPVRCMIKECFYCAFRECKSFKTVDHRHLRKRW